MGELRQGKIYVLGDIWKKYNRSPLQSLQMPFADLLY